MLFRIGNSWSLSIAGSYRTTIRASTRSCARTCSFRGISPFLPRGIGGPVGKVWQTGCHNYCCHHAKPCGILRPMHAGQSGCYRNRNAIGRDERQCFGVRPARRNPQLFSGLDWHYPGGWCVQRQGVRLDLEVEPTIGGVRAGRNAGSGRRNNQRPLPEGLKKNGAIRRPGR